MRDRLVCCWPSEAEGSRGGGGFSEGDLGVGDSLDGCDHVNVLVTVLDATLDVPPCGLEMSRSRRLVL